MSKAPKHRPRRAPDWEPEFADSVQRQRHAAMMALRAKRRAALAGGVK